MYILVLGWKGRYDDPISLDIIGTYNTEEDASEVLKRYLPPKDGLKEAINNKKEYYKENLFDSPLNFRYSENGNLISYSTDCPADNEYEGETYSIFKVGE